MIKIVLFLVSSFFSSTLLALSFEGTWKTSCVNGQQKIQVIKSDRIATFEIFFQDYQCQKLSFYFLNQGRYRLSVKELRVKGNSEGEIDFTFDSVGFNIFNPQIEFQFNQQQICGYEDWKLKQIKNITGHQCRFFSAAKISQVPGVGDKRFGIFKVSENQLYFGKLDSQHNALTPATRPVEFDPWYYSRN